MITIVLFDASIEIPPLEIRNHPAIVNDAKRRGRDVDQILLYLPKHRFAMGKLDNFEKRGRPDITHRSLLLILDSPLNKLGFLKILVSTINNEVFEFSPEVRLPKDFYQFEGLMVQLLKTGVVPPNGKPLIWKVSKSLNEVLEECDYKALFSENGRMITYEDWKKIIKSKSAILIGAFQKGEISKQIYELADDVFSISKFPLMTTTVVCRVLAYLEITASNEGIISEL